MASTFFVKGVVSGFDCTSDPITNQRFLDSQPDVECVGDDAEYSEIRTLSSYGVGGWVSTFALISLLFLGKGGKERFNFLTGKMEDSWYWWELWLLTRKVGLILCPNLSAIADAIPALQLLSRLAL